MKYKKLISFLAFFLAVLSVYGQNPFVLKSGEPVTVACGNSEEEVVHTALNLLNRDVESVFSTRIIVTPESKKGMIIVGTIGQSDLIDKAGVDLSPIKNKKEAFLLTVSSNGKLVIAGSDKRGTAYGVMELSRLIGVSPWEWWADATPAKKEIFQLPASYRNMQSPSVEYRGIFINDEDWGLTPWSWQTYEPSDVKGQIGPKTHERIFELLLRLRANTFWPAMHGCSVPFYFTPGNKEVADKFGIFIGTSHCEPMMRNTNGEWKRDGVGEYDYVHNSAHVLSFWEQRVKEVAGLDNLYTLGMRGVHDGAMNGAKTIEEQKAVLTKVLKDQRDLLTKYVNKDVTQVPQVFIPYKEVLDVYHAGLQVPDEVDLSPLIGVVLQVGHQLLHAVLAADGDARPDGVANGVGSLHFGGGHQGDVLGVPSGCFGGLTHVLPHGRDVRGDGFIALCLWHGFNVPPFRRLVLRRPAPPGPRPARCGYLLRSWERL